MTNEHRERRKQERLWKKSVSFAYVILTLSISAGLYTLEKRDIERTDTAALTGCERVNILRGNLNSVTLVAYRAFYSGAQREKELAQKDKRNAKDHLASYNNLLTAAKSLKFQGLTNCHRAVQNPKVYVPPRSRSYTPDDLK